MVVVLTGQNDYSLQEKLQVLVNEFRKKHGESIERFDASEINKTDGILDAVRSVSFLEPRKMVIVRDFGQSKQLMEKIEDIIEQTAETTELILVDPKLDKRTSAYKLLAEKCKIFHYDILKNYELEKWLKDEANKLNIKISGLDVQFLVDRVGPNQQMLFQELNKLALNNKNISRQQIEDMVEANPQSKVFDMLEALFSGNGELAEKLYKEQRALGEEPQKIIAMITWQLQQLTLAVYSKTKSVGELVEAGMSSYSAQNALNLARRITKNDLKTYISELAEIDMRSKTDSDVESSISVYFSEVIGLVKN